MSADTIDALVEESAPTTRCRILATAERFFREIGYQKTTVADIARTLGMSPANVYRFFDSKRAINEAVFARLCRGIEGTLAEIAAETGTGAAERLSTMIRALHRECRERCEDFPRIHEMVEAAMTESWPVCRSHVETLQGSLARVIADGVQTDAFDVPDPAVAAACVQTAVTRYHHPVLISVARSETAAPPLEAMIAFLLKGLGAAERG